jgi:transcriptional regulator with XRE-family HTH domain
MRTMNNINLKLVNKSEIARIVGMTPQYVWMLLNGKRKNPKARKLVEQAIKKHFKSA